MVMLQNKKSSDQIIHDLNPFLGPDGSRAFVHWLWTQMTAVATSNRLIIADANEKTYSDSFSQSQMRNDEKRSDSQPRKDHGASDSRRPEEDPRKSRRSSEYRTRSPSKSRTRSRAHSRSRDRSRSRSGSRARSPSPSRVRNRTRERRSRSQKRDNKTEELKRESNERGVHSDQRPKRRSRSPSRAAMSTGSPIVDQPSQSRRRSSYAVHEPKTSEDFIVVKDDPDDMIPAARDFGAKRKRQEARQEETEDAPHAPHSKRRSILERLSSAPPSSSAPNLEPTHPDDILSADLKDQPVRFTVIFDELPEFELRAKESSTHSKSTFRYFTNESKGHNSSSFIDSSLILCKFYPFCTSTSCAFLHPQEMCSNFPECPFGKKCHFLHPPEMCKYGNLCHKEHCVRIHPPKPPVPCKRGFACSKEGCTFVHPQEKCSFGDTCKNAGCRFSHNKDCRYGVKCYIPGCKFAHSRQQQNDSSPKLAAEAAVAAEQDEDLALVVEPDNEDSDGVM
eukprot:TRINITY_DN1509_c0_g1_i2.p1 TRINITY_DN1509_c0_g1~~TRINITY_DN1509_c0_g1_i2.p1  ORF type:complete len:506 (+),score=33.68 TRINITY_DN1509_c0_g1_i2:243-1760(+)